MIVADPQQSQHRPRRRRDQHDQRVHYDDVSEQPRRRGSCAGVFDPPPRLAIQSCTPRKRHGTYYVLVIDVLHEVRVGCHLEEKHAPDPALPYADGSKQHVEGED